MDRSERITVIEQVLRGPSYGGVEGLAERIVDALFTEPAEPQYVGVEQDDGSIVYFEV